jgi:hypothetical protein
MNFRDRDMEIFARCPVIQSHIIFENQILVITNLFSDHPKEFIDVYDLEDNLQKKYPLSYDIDMIFTKKQSALRHQQLRKK